MDDLHQLLDAQRRAFRTLEPPGSDSRRRSLKKLEQLVSGNVNRIAEAISEDFGGRARAETELLEIVPMVRAIRHARRHVAHWMKPERRSVDPVFLPARAWVRFEPLGVVGIISPWNYPLLLSIGPLCDTLAAGNRAMIKPSDLTPRFSLLLQQLVAETFPPEDVVVVPGDVAVARAFSSLPFDHIVFTGSGAVGREVMRAAADNLTPVTLELGGKSPAIVAADYPIGKAARSIAFGKFVNAGQTCIAPDYALVPDGHVTAFATEVLAQAKLSYPSIADNEHYSAIVTAKHRDRLNAAISEARKAGATILTHEAQPDDAAKIAPTIVIDPPPNCLLMQEEIFGPVLPVLPYRTIEEAAAFVAERDKPLALYLFTHDDQTRETILDRAQSGGVTLNGTLLHIAQDALPFGGVGASGTGAYHGYDGFRRLSHARSVHAIGFTNLFEKLGPPWGARSRIMTRFLSKW